jgi:uncharacterized repeat protein (TIGR01451 family)
MKAMTRFLLSAILFFTIDAASAQTTFKIDSVHLDSVSTNVSYCLGKQYSNISIEISLSNYTVGDSVELTINYGDGVTETKKFRIYGSGSLNYVYTSFYHKFISPGTFRPIVTAVAPDLKTDTKICSGLAVVDVCGTIEGNVYFDANNNCVKDLGEKQSHWAVVKATNTVTKAVSFGYINGNGNYYIDVPYSYTYDLELSSAYGLQTCPTGGYKNVSVPSYSKNFGYQCGSSFDLTGFAWLSGSIRPGLVRRFTGRAINASCTPVSGTYQLVVSDPLLSHNPFPLNYAYYKAPNSINGDTVTWNFSNIAWPSWSNWVGSNPYFGYGIKIDTAAKIGDTVCVTIIVKPIAGDRDSSNNIKKFCWVVGNSYDPNNKVGQPIGIGPDKIIDRGQDINYTVNFQNTGNDTAYKIVVVDTVSPHLDLASLEIIGATHPFNFYVVGENVIRFEFLDIYLPDSTTNEPLSHGSVHFTLHQKPNLAYGTIITNEASIFFDYNEAILTNTEHHRVDLISGIEDAEIAGIEFDMYPNPASDKLFVEIFSLEKVQFRLYNMLGHTHIQQRLSNGKHNLDLGHLTNGIYFVEITSEHQRVVRKLVIQH